MLVLVMFLVWWSLLSVSTFFYIRIESRSEESFLLSTTLLAYLIAKSCAYLNMSFLLKGFLTIIIAPSSLPAISTSYLILSAHFVFLVFTLILLIFLVCILFINSGFLANIRATMILLIGIKCNLGQSKTVWCTEHNSHLCVSHSLGLNLSLSFIIQ